MEVTRQSVRDQGPKISEVHTGSPGFIQLFSARLTAEISDYGLMSQLDPFFSNRPAAKPENYLPLTFRGIVVGFVDRRLEERVRQSTEAFSCPSQVVEILDHDLDYAARSARLDTAVRHIYDADMTGFGKWCPETTPVVPSYGHTPVFELQRAAVGFFGVLTTGVHLNVYSNICGTPHLWIAQRADHLASHPGMLDQAVAGFLPVGASPWPKLFEEAGEEAGLPASDVRQAHPAGSIEFAIDRDPGLQRGAVFVFDLEVPPDSHLESKDGEISEHRLMAPAQVIASLNEHRFKFDSALVAVDFLVRHGCLDCADSAYLSICSTLHGQAVSFGLGTIS